MDDYYFELAKALCKPTPAQALWEIEEALRILRLMRDGDLNSEELTLLLYKAIDTLSLLERK